MKLLLPLREMSFAFNPDATLCIFCYIYGKYRKPKELKEFSNYRRKSTRSENNYGRGLIV